MDTAVELVEEKKQTGKEKLKLQAERQIVNENWEQMTIQLLEKRVILVKMFTWILIKSILNYYEA